MPPPRALGRALFRLPRGVKQLVPLGMRQSIRHRVGPFAPWERGFSSAPPPLPAGHVAGPPDFVGIGAQKAGTTWWFDLLSAHPGVHHPAGMHKERHFFAPFALEPFGPDDVARYHRWFPRPPGSVIGEWTPDYLEQPWAASLLAVAAPETRLLVMLRDPVERFLSGVAHTRLHGGSHLGAELADAFRRGCYASALRPWTDAFPADRLLVLQYERCVADPAGEIERTQRFLGLEPAPAPDAALVRRVASTGDERPAVSLEARRRLAGLYAAEVEALVAAVPGIDLGLWPDFGG